MENNRRMNIAVALDSNYVRYTYVMLTSLFENQEKDQEIHIYLLQSKLTEKEKQCLEKLVESYKGSLYWIEINRSVFEKIGVVTTKWPLESYYRLMLQDILPEEVERILYLDVDVVVNNSLYEVYNTDFEGNDICACAEFFSEIGFSDIRDEIFKEYIKEGFTYFNSGVLLMNIRLMREKYHLKDYMKAAEKLKFNLKTPDQDLLNYVHWDSVKIIDMAKYNLYARFAHNCGVTYEEVKEQTTIVHFLAGKPWDGKIKHFGIEKLWWNYAKMTPFYEGFVKEFINGKETLPEAKEYLKMLTGEENGNMKNRKLKWSISYMDYLLKNDILEYLHQEGIAWVEVPYEKIEEYEQWVKNTEEKNKIPKVSGIVIHGKELDEDKLFYAVMKAEEWGAHHITIDTEEVSSRAPILNVFENCIELIVEKEIPVYLENGYIISKNGDYQCSEFSEMLPLRVLTKQLNQICEKECFGISLNVGNANLLAKNIRVMAEEAEDQLKMVRISDNDGFHNDRQMPYTYTKGRGNKTTDWQRLIGELRRSHYNGWMVFDEKGTFEKSPEPLHKSYISLLTAIVKEWEEVLKLEEYLNQPDKKLIFFGAGVMAHSFMNTWGEKYRPEFLVDNNPSLWNKERFGIAIKSPQAILEIPEEERNVFIGNQYYMQIGTQLESMGIKFRCYSDLYDV